MTKDRLITEYIKMISYLCELRAEDIKPERIAIWANSLSVQKINMYVLREAFKSLSKKAEPRLSFPIILDDYNKKMEACLRRADSLKDALLFERPISLADKQFLVDMGESKKTLDIKIKRC